MLIRKKSKQSYHHGDLAESFLNAVDEIATKFGLEAVTLRACAKLVGVAPSAAFRHYADKRALFTAFATRALNQLADKMEQAFNGALAEGQNHGHAFAAVGSAYVRFSLEHPAYFQVMWRSDLIYTEDEDYCQASTQIRGLLHGGFVSTLNDDNPDALSSGELLAWSSVHGLAALMIDGPLADEQPLAEKMRMAEAMISTLGPALANA